MSTGEEKAESQSKQWLIVYCEKDESFSLIQESEAVCDKSILETNDKVIFFFQGEAWQGEVRAIGGDEDYDDLVHRLKEMNALNRKKDSSFHADQPRKTRGGKYAAAIQTLVPRSKTQVRPIAGKNTIEVKPNSGKDDILSGSETEDASSSSESPSTSPLPEELSPNDVRKTAQLKRRGADNDVMILKKMRTEMNQNLNNAPTQELTRRTSIIGFKNTFGTESDEETTCDQEGTEENFEGEEPDEGKEADKKKKKADDKKKKEADDKKKRESDDKKKKEADDKKKKEADDKKKKEPDDKKKKESDDKKIKEADDKKKKEADDKKKKEADDKRKEADDKKKKEADDKRKEADDKKKKEANDKKKKEADDKKKEANDKKKKEAQDKRKEEAGESNSSDEGGQKEGNKEESESSGPETDKGVESQEEKLSEDEEKTPNRKTKKKKKKDKKSKGEPLKADFKVLRWTKDDDDVVEIAGKSNDLSGKHFFISRDDFQKAKSAKAASTFSKALLMGAFTDEALLKCSVSGGEYRAGGRANITRKPALPADVVAVIIDNAMYRQSGKKWSPTLNKKEIMNGLRQKLVDVRGRLRKKFESSD